MNRRALLQSTAALAATSAWARADQSPRRPTKRELDRVLNSPVLKTELLSGPVKVASIELLRCPLPARPRRSSARTAWCAAQRTPALARPSILIW
ncbi:MAG TPA: hypothetical protein VG433_07990 [Pirellulales bacterium]|nr:hypothetical protein [Pirellulales bacterium]